MDGNLTERLQDNAHQLAQHALDQLKTASLSPAAVHDCRVAVKQLRAHWQLLRPWLSRNVHRQIDAELRDGARVLAGARDDHVLLVTLDKLARKARQPEQPALQRLRHQLLAQANPVPADQDHQQAVNAFRNDLLHWQALRLTPTDHELLNTGLARTYKQCRHRTRKAADSPDPHAWHDLRKWVKYLLYQQRALGLEVASQDGLNLLGSQLGKLHDLHMLQDVATCRPDKTLSPEDRKTVIAVIARCEKTLLKKCQSSALALFELPTRKWIRQAAH